jgi:hypothetical protein
MAAHLPSEAYFWEPNEIVNYLKNMQEGDMFRLRMKKKSLAEDWAYATATRTRDGFAVILDMDETIETVLDANEDCSLISFDNWAIGWYSLVPPAGGKSPNGKSKKKEKRHHKQTQSEIASVASTPSKEDIGNVTELDSQDHFNMSPLKCSRYTLCGKQATVELSLTKESRNAQLYQTIKVSQSGVTASSSDVVCIQGGNHVFYYAAVPIVDNGSPSPLEALHYGVIYNTISKGIECVLLKEVHLLQSTTPDQVDDEIMKNAQEACLSWLLSTQFCSIHCRQQFGEKEQETHTTAPERSSQNIAKRNLIPTKSALHKTQSRKELKSAPCVTRLLVGSPTG